MNQREVLALPEEFYEKYCIPCFGLKTSYFGSEPQEITTPLYQEGHYRDGQSLAGQTKNGIFGYNNSTISFVNEKGLFFAAPYRKDIMDILRNHGYYQDYLYVPLSNQELIVENDFLLAKYNWLRAQSRAEK